MAEIAVAGLGGMLGGALAVAAVLVWAGWVEVRWPALAWSRRALGARA